MFAFVRRIPFALTMTLAIGVALVSFRFLLPQPPGVSPDIAANRFADPALVIHAGFAAVALLLGPFQFIGRGGKNGGGRRAIWHRFTGALYMAACLAAAPAGLVLALGTTAGPLATAGFGLLALVWFHTTAQGLRAVIGRRYAEHRRWMIRSFALTFAAVTLRLYLPIAPSLGYDFMPAYVAISWLCWIPNLILAEWLFVPLRPRPPTPQAA